MDKLKSLIEVKKIIALVLTGVFAYLSIIKVVTATEFIVVFSTIVGYYFGQSSTRSAIQENKTNVTQ